jgi:hypothetical protein
MVFEILLMVFWRYLVCVHQVIFCDEAMAVICFKVNMFSLCHLVFHCGFR